MELLLGKGKTSIAGDMIGSCDFEHIEVVLSETLTKEMFPFWDFKSEGMHGKENIIPVIFS